MAEAIIATANTAPASVSSPNRARVQAFHELLERFVLGKEPNHDGIVLESTHHTTAPDGEVDHLGQEGLDLTGAPFLSLGRVQRFFEPSELGLHGGDDDRLFGSELVVDRRLRHTHRVGDHL